MKSPNLGGRIPLANGNFITGQHFGDQGNREQFYILVEYNPPNIIDNDYIPIVSSDNFYINHHPTLVVNYNKSSEVDSLINRFDFINDNIITTLESINDIRTRYIYKLHRRMFIRR